MGHIPEAHQVIRLQDHFDVLGPMNTQSHAHPHILRGLHDLPVYPQKIGLLESLDSLSEEAILRMANMIGTEVDADK